jgi:hypothetical protein
MYTYQQYQYDAKERQEKARKQQDAQRENDRPTRRRK